MDLKKENGKYVFDCVPEYKNNFPIVKNGYLEAPLTKCSSVIMDKIIIYPYEYNTDIRKTSIKIFYFDVPSQEKYRIDIKYFVEHKGFFSKQNEKQKYWKIEVFRVNSYYDNGQKTDGHYFGASLSHEIEIIFKDNRINKKNIIEFLLKFDYTKYSKNRNLRIGGM